MKERYTCKAEIGNICFVFDLEFEKSLHFFQANCDAGEIIDSDTTIHVSVEEQYWREMLDHGYPRSGQIETSLLTALVSDRLLDNNEIIIHAVAFSFQGKGWLICADPGVGKSTQIRYLMDLYPGEFEVICGDRPIIQRCEDGSFEVGPSPWNGKEGWKGAEAAPLAGILLLKRDEITEIRRLRPKEAVLPVSSALISTRETESLIYKLADFEDDLLMHVPVYEYRNGGVPDSSRILYRFLTERNHDEDL